MGGGYAAWGLYRFDPLGDPRDDPGFDRPVAKLAFLYQGYQGGLDRIEPETMTEQVLHEVLTKGLRWNAGLLMMLIRLFLGSFAALTGLAVLTVVVERQRLLAIIDRLEAGPSTREAGPDLRGS